MSRIAIPKQPDGDLQEVNKLLNEIKALRQDVLAEDRSARLDALHERIEDYIECCLMLEAGEV